MWWNKYTTTFGKESLYGLYADVVELVDTLDSGSSAGNSMKVQVLSSALNAFLCDIFSSFRLRLMN
jgi:hypothetical protein